MKRSLYLSIIVIAMVVGLFSSCMGTMPRAREKRVKQANQIDLVKANHEVHGVWNSNDLSLSYHYLVSDQTLKINADITLATKLTHFSVMDRLRIWLHFVNSEGRVLESRVIYTSPYRKSISMLNLGFRRSFPMPPNSVAMAFTYAGKVSEGSRDKDGGISWDFWNGL